MNLTIDREVLLENLNTISRGLPAKSPMPILTGIKLYVTENDLFMTSSNSDISVEVTINDASLEIKEPGQTVVPGKFIDIIRKINSRKVNLYLAEDKILVIKADRGEYKLYVMDPLEYPKMDFVALENPLKLSADLLKNIIKSTVFATSSSEKKPILTGVNFSNTNNTLTVVATDSFRLSQRVVSIDNYNDFNITIPNKSLDELIKAIDQYQGDVNLYFQANKLLAQFKNVCFQTRLLDGNYPDTSKLIGSNYSINLTFNKDELIEAVERVSLLSPRDSAKDKEITYSIIKLSIKKDRIIEISTNNSTLGDAKEELIPTSIEASNPITIGFSSRYLLDSLRSLMSTEISLNLSGEIRPFIIRGDNDANLTELILPVRMDN
jgi:DNA polymerase-3 subunit beta